MSDVKAEHTGDATEVHTEPELVYRSGWKIPGTPLKVPHYRTPMAQILLVGFVCFLCPGMFNALGGMGGGGQLDHTVNSDSNTALYSTFAVFGFFSGTILNRIGSKATLSIGGLGYAVYSASYLCYNHTKNRGFVTFAGCLTGFCAALLWCAQGTVMMSYPTEQDKGKYIGIFWAIFNLGGVIGSIIPIADSWDLGTANVAVKDGVYVGFLVLMLFGAVLGFFLSSPEKVVRKDGTRVMTPRHPSVWSEFEGLWRTLWTDSYIIWLFPFFLASNWFYTYQQNSYNLFFFNTRTKAFNSLWYWTAQIFGALIFGAFLDNKRMSRVSRARWGLGFLFVIVNAIWGGGLKAELQMHRPSDPSDTSSFWGMDVVNTGKYPGYLILYICYGLLDALWQTYAYWIMGALSNEPRKLAYFAGFYKGIQSAGGAIAWGLDSHNTSYGGLFGSSWGLCVFGMIMAVPIVWKRIKETEITAEDFVDPAKAHEIGILEAGEMATTTPQAALGAAATHEVAAEPAVNEKI